MSNEKQSTMWLLDFNLNKYDKRGFFAPNVATK